jgi:hypothetical protein
MAERCGLDARAPAEVARRVLVAMAHQVAYRRASAAGAPTLQFHNGKSGVFPGQTRVRWVRLGQSSKKMPFFPGNAHNC